MMNGGEKAAYPAFSCLNLTKIISLFMGETIVEARHLSLVMQHSGLFKILISKSVRGGFWGYWVLTEQVNRRR